MIPIRDENPTRGLPIVTLALIAANIVAFGYQITLPPHLAQDLVMRRGLVPFEVSALPSAGGAAPLGEGLLSFISSMFLHGDIIHLAGNMLFLWIFGNNIEDVLGSFRFTLFYVICGVAAALAQVAAMPHSTVPMVGASGAIAGILGAYLLLFPRAKILTIIPAFFLYIVRLPAFVVLGMWFLFQIVHSLLTAGRPGGGVAFFAHIGGFVAGMIFMPVFRPASHRSEPPLGWNGR